MVLGLIAEYNPFHNGHLLHIKKSKKITKSSSVVVAMSGNYVQRGEPAICDKYSRTKMALANGADLVLEIPVYYSTSSAEYFAKNAVTLLDKSNIVDCLCFGSEVGNISDLDKISQILIDENPIYVTNLKENLAKGLSFPEARNNSVNIVIDKKQNILNKSNNILGIEYLKALKNLNSAMKPFTIKREMADYNRTSLSGNISSATAIRNSINNNNFSNVGDTMPKTSLNILLNEISGKKSPINLDDFSFLLHYLLKTKSLNTIKEICDVTEGLENRIIKYSTNNFLISDILKELKTKRYTFTKLQRALLHILLNITKTDFRKFNMYGAVQYIRVLGFKRESVFLVKELEKKSSLPIVMNLKNANRVLDKLGMEMLNKEIETTDLYYLLAKKNGSVGYNKNIEYSIPLVIAD